MSWSMSRVQPSRPTIVYGSDPDEDAPPTTIYPLQAPGGVTPRELRMAFVDGVVGGLFSLRQGGGKCVSLRGNPARPTGLPRHVGG